MLCSCRAVRGAAQTSVFSAAHYFPGTSAASQSTARSERAESIHKACSMLLLFFKFPRFCCCGGAFSPHFSPPRIAWWQPLQPGASTSSTMCYFLCLTRVTFNSPALSSRCELVVIIICGNKELERFGPHLLMPSISV
jgi:hypothetical protein